MVQYGPSSTIFRAIEWDRFQSAAKDVGGLGSGFGPQVTGLIGYD